MRNKQNTSKNEEQTLITLDQLSQTLEVMTCVIERLKQHLTRQISLNTELFRDEESVAVAEQEARSQESRRLQQESFIVEITQEEMEEGYDPETVH